MRKVTSAGSKTTAPIKSLSDLHAMHHYFLGIAKSASTPSKRQIAYRNWFYFALGINLGYRGGDITELTWDQLVTYNPSKNTYTVRKDEYNRINAEKTGKSTILYFNDEAERCINFYLKATGIKPFPNTPVFFSRKSAGTREATVSGHIDCDNMGRILKHAAKVCSIPGNICTHSLRKTFGYQYYRETGDIITLQKILGHENPGITLTYIGITAEDIMRAYDVKPNTCIDDLDAWLPEVLEDCIKTPEASIETVVIDEAHPDSAYGPNPAYGPEVACETDTRKINRKPSAFYSDYKYPIHGGASHVANTTTAPTTPTPNPAQTKCSTPQSNIRYFPTSRWQSAGIAN